MNNIQNQNDSMRRIKAPLVIAIVAVILVALVVFVVFFANKYGLFSDSETRLLLEKNPRGVISEKTKNYVIVDLGNDRKVKIEKDDYNRLSQIVYPETVAEGEKISPTAQTIFWNDLQAGDLIKIDPKKQEISVEVKYNDQNQEQPQDKVYIITPEGEKIEIPFNKGDGFFGF